MRRVLLVLLGVLLSSPAFAQVAFDAGATGTSSATFSFSHTVTGSNPLLVVCIKDTPTPDVSGVTYNSVAMTEVSGSPVASAGGARYSRAFTLTNPATGAHNVTVTLLGSGTSVWAASGSWTGVKQTGQPEATAVNSLIGGGTLTTSVTTVTANAWTVYCATDNGSTLAASTGATQRQVSAGPLVGLFDSNAGLSVGSHSQAVTGASYMDGFLLSLAPATVTATPCRSRSLLGVGCDQ